MAQPQKRRPESARRANRIIQTRTLLLLGVFGVLTFVLLFAKLYHWQITEHDELQSVAVRQQTLRTTVEASRGTIYDRNGTILAMSASAEDIFLSPKEIVENDQDQNLIANGLAEILNLDAADILKKMEKTNSQYEILKKKADDELADKVREFINKNELRGVFLRPTSKRSYPKGTLASQVIGFANDNGGSMGLEATYNDELTGENGMVVTARDRDGRSVLYQYDQYFDAENGCDLHTTLDTTIQYYLEKGVQELEARFGTGKGATGIVMDVNTGAVLAMASLPTYDLNAPGKVYNDFLTSGMTEEQIEENMKDLLNKQWRSKAINDTYEPGSTFKSVVLAAALEEGVVSESDTFECTGSVNIAGSTIRCSDRKGHGTQTLAKAVANSCNPAFIAIGQRLGAERFYDYLEDFGFLETTGIDMQGEANSTVWSREWFTGPYGEASLATASFGQRFNVTPIQLITAASAVINGGHLMQPYVLESITDADGNVIQSTEPTERRQVVSEATSEKCRIILEGVVNGGTGKNAYQAGYRIGGKTGSSETLEDDHTIVSFLGFAPADDPQVVILIAFDNPKPVSPGSNYTAGGYYISGGVMGATRAGELLANILDYMGVEKQYTAEELSGADVLAPSVTGLSLADAQAKAEAVGLTVRTVGDGETVTDQIPIQGASIPGGSEMVLYMGEAKPTDQVEVPDLSGKSPETVRQTLSNLGLYMKATGVSDYYTSSTIAAGQSIAAGTMVDRGTVVEVQFMDNTATTAGAGI